MKKQQSNNSDIVMKFLFMLIVVAATLGIAYQVHVRIPNQIQAKHEERIEAKLDYITNDTFTTYKIKDIRWERRSQKGIFNSEADSYDVFLITTSGNALERIAIYDISIQGQYYVTSYDKQIGGVDSGE